MWKLAVVVVAANAASEALGTVHFFLAWIGGAAVFWIFMVKWFEVDFFGAFIIIAITVTVRAWLVFLLMGLLSALL